MTITPIAQQINLFMKLFIHRSDAFMQKKVGPGWKPVRDEGKDRPFGEEVALSHLEGRCRLGIFPLKPAPRTPAFGLRPTLMRMRTPLINLGNYTNN